MTRKIILVFMVAIVATHPFLSPIRDFTRIPDSFSSTVYQQQALAAEPVSIRHRGSGLPSAPPLWRRVIQKLRAMDTALQQCPVLGGLSVFMAATHDESYYDPLVKELDGFSDQHLKHFLAIADPVHHSMLPFILLDDDTDVISTTERRLLEIELYKLWPLDPPSTQHSLIAIDDRGRIAGKVKLNTLGNGIDFIAIRSGFSEDQHHALYQELLAAAFVRITRKLPKERFLPIYDSAFENEIPVEPHVHIWAPEHPIESVSRKNVLKFIAQEKEKINALISTHPSWKITRLYNGERFFQFSKPWYQHWILRTPAVYRYIGDHAILIAHQPDRFHAQLPLFNRVLLILNWNINDRQFWKVLSTDDYHKYWESNPLLNFRPSKQDHLVLTLPEALIRQTDLPLQGPGWSIESAHRHLKVMPSVLPIRAAS